MNIEHIKSLSLKDYLANKGLYDLWNVSKPFSGRE